MLLHKEKTYQIIGACMEVHRILGKGLQEIVYKDALEYELQLREIPFEREKRYDVVYKGVTLKHYFIADFVVFDEIIVEIKAIESIMSDHIRQTLNYISIAQTNLGLIVNFGPDSLEHRRVIR